MSIKVFNYKITMAEQKTILAVYLNDEKYKKISSGFIFDKKDHQKIVGEVQTNNTKKENEVILQKVETISKLIIELNNLLKEE